MSKTASSRDAASHLVALASWQVDGLGGSTRRGGPSESGRHPDCARQHPDQQNATVPNISPAMCVPGQIEKRGQDGAVVKVFVCS